MSAHDSLARDLARHIAAIRRKRHYRGRLLGTWDNDQPRTRASAWTLSQRLRERGIVMPERDVLEGLVVLLDEGLVRRGEGGWAVVDWDGLRLFGEVSP